MVPSKWLQSEFNKRSSDQFNGQPDRVKTVDSYLQEAVLVVFRDLVAKLYKKEWRAKVDLNQLIIPDYCEDIASSNGESYTFKYPERFYHRMNQKAYAVCPDCKNVKGKNNKFQGERWLKVLIYQNDDLDEALRDDDQKPSYQWEQTIAKDTGSSLIIYGGPDFVITRACMDYIMRPSMPYTPSNMIDEKYINSSGEEIKSDVGVEFDYDIASIIVDVAVLFALGDDRKTTEFQTQLRKTLDHERR